MGSAKFAHASNCRKMARNDDRERMGFARTGEVKSPYRGNQTLVQGRSSLRTGEIESPYRGEAEPMKGSIEV